MASPMGIPARRGDDARTIPRLSRDQWYWIAVAAASLLAAVSIAARSGMGSSVDAGRSGPGPNSTHAGQPGGPRVIAAG